MTMNYSTAPPGPPPTGLTLVTKTSAGTHTDRVTELYADVTYLP